MHRLLAIALSSTLAMQAVPLMASPAASADRARAKRAAATTGVINGTVQSAAGRTLPDCGVQVRDLRTGKLAATSVSNAQGAFSFAGLPPASYIVEVVSKNGEVVGSNAALPVGGGKTVKTAVAATAVPTTADASASSIATAAAVTKAATAAAITGMASPAGRDHASPSR